MVEAADMKNKQVREIVQQAIDGLKAIGLSEAGAHRLLLIQSAIRIDSASTIRSALSPWLEE